MADVIRCEVQTATRGAVEWGVFDDGSIHWFRTRWAARTFAAAVENGDSEQTLADLKADKQLVWINFRPAGALP